MRRCVPIRSVAAAATFAVMLSVSGASAAAGDCREIAAATATTDAVTVCREDVWVHAPDKAGNVGAVPSWDTTPPAASVTGGAGGGYATVRVADIAQPYDTKWRPTFTGTYTGTIDNVAATAYLFTPVYQATGTAFPLLVRLTIDDEIIFEQSAAEIDVPITPGGDAAGKIQFAITGIAEEMAALRMDNAADTEHTVSLQIINNYWGDGHTVIVYDTTEVPTGLVFNHEEDKTLKPYTVIPVVAP